MKAVLIQAAVLCLLVITICALYLETDRLEADRDRYKANMETAMTDAQQYMASDSLHAARCAALELKVSEFERLRANDAELILQLKIKKKELERVASVGTEARTIVTAPVRDTVIIRDTIVPAQTITYRSPWCDMDGVIASGEFSGEIVMRDSLLVVETVTMGGCFLRRKVKGRKIDVVSRNKNVIVTHVGYVTIKQK